MVFKTLAKSINKHFGSGYLKNMDQKYAHLQGYDDTFNVLDIPMNKLGGKVIIL